MPRRRKSILAAASGVIRLTAIGCLGLLAMLVMTPLRAAETALQLIDRMPEGSDWRLLDTRPTLQCEKRSIQGARCLTADDLLGHSGRLPSLRDIVWLLGTLGLQGSETVVVAGRPGEARDFIAGLLYLAGQRRVLVLQPPLSRLIASGEYPLAAGQRRSMSRERHYVAPPRDGQIVLRRELQQRLSGNQPLRLLDARSQAEYWGEQVRGWRGGHIPGAEPVSLETVPAIRLTEAGADTVVYGHAPLDSIAALVRLQAHWPQPVQVFIEGWRAWSADGSLPVDAESYKDT